METKENKKLDETISTFSNIFFDTVIRDTLSPVSEIESEDVRKARKIQEISDVIKNHINEAKEGTKLFVTLDKDGTLKPILTKLAKATFETLSAPGFFTEEEFLTLMQKAIDVYKAGNLIEASSMFTCLMNLFPTQIQPYICYATVMWKQSGIDDAVNYYNQITELLPNPLLMLYAADCYRSAGDTLKAKSTLQKGIQLCEEDEQTFSSVKNDLSSALEKLEQLKTEV